MDCDYEVFVRARHSGDNHAARRADCRENQRGFVAHAARRVFCDFRARDVGKFNRFAGENHFVGKDGGFLRRHVFEENRHDERRHLEVGHFVVENRVYDIANFVFRKFVPVALFLYKIRVGGFEGSFACRSLCCHVIDSP